jgi:hypothetical protein
MEDDPIRRMRERARQLRRMLTLAHDPRLTEPMRRMADEVEADADRLERKLKQSGRSGLS